MQCSAEAHNDRLRRRQHCEGRCVGALEVLYQSEMYPVPLASAACSWAMDETRTEDVLCEGGEAELELLSRSSMTLANTATSAARQPTSRTAMLALHAHEHTVTGAEKVPEVSTHRGVAGVTSTFI